MVAVTLKIEQLSSFSTQCSLLAKVGGQGEGSIGTELTVQLGVSRESYNATFKLLKFANVETAELWSKHK